MMINKRLIAMMGDSKRYIARNVALQWVALLANIAMIFAVSAFLAGLVYSQGSLSAALLVLLGALVVRFFCTRGAASASYNASRTVKKTLRAAIYEKLLRLGGSYTQAVPTAEVLQLAARASNSSRPTSARTFRSFSTPCSRPSHCLSRWPRSACGQRSF